MDSEQIAKWIIGHLTEDPKMNALVVTMFLTATALYISSVVWEILRWINSKIT